MDSGSRLFLWLLCCGMCCLGFGLTLLLVFMFPLASNLERRLRTNYVEVDYKIQNGELTRESGDEWQD